MNSIYSAPPRDPAGTRASRLPAPSENALIRSAFAVFVATSKVSALHRSSDEVAAALWPQDRTTAAVLKAPTAPGASADHPGLVQSVTGDFLAGLQSISAGASLVAAGLGVRLDGRGTITFPARDFALSGLPWIGENEAIPVRQFAFGERTLGPAGTVAVIVPLSRELARRSAALPIFGQLLREEAALALDSALFSAAAASASNPAGLLNGLSRTPVDVARMDETLEALAGRVAVGGGTGKVAFVAAPRQAVQIMMRRPDLAFPVWASPALPNGQIIALDPTGFVSSISSVGIDTSDQATLHMSDDPQEIVAEGGVTGAPVRSLWQTGAIAVRVWLDIAFLMRADGLVAYTDGVNWSDYA